MIGVCNKLIGCGFTPFSTIHQWDHGGQFPGFLIPVLRYNTFSKQPVVPHKLLVNRWMTNGCCRIYCCQTTQTLFSYLGFEFTSPGFTVCKRNKGVSNIKKDLLSSNEMLISLNLSYGLSLHPIKQAERLQWRDCYVSLQVYAYVLYCASLLLIRSLCAVKCYQWLFMGSIAMINTFS